VWKSGEKTCTPIRRRRWLVCRETWPPAAATAPKDGGTKSFSASALDRPRTVMPTARDEPAGVRANGGGVRPVGDVGRRTAAATCVPSIASAATTVAFGGPPSVTLGGAVTWTWTVVPFTWARCAYRRRVRSLTDPVELRADRLLRPQPRRFWLVKAAVLLVFFVLRLWWCRRAPFGSVETFCRSMFGLCQTAFCSSYSASPSVRRRCRRPSRSPPPSLRVARRRRLGPP